MKISRLALVAVLALTGCSAGSDLDFGVEPNRTVPAVDANDAPAPTGVSSWDADSIEYFGASNDLEEIARESAQAVHDFAEENPESTVAHLSLTRASVKRPGNVEFMISDDLSGNQLQQVAMDTACAITEEMPETLSGGASWLGYLTLISTTAGDVYTFSDTQTCE